MLEAPKICKYIQNVKFIKLKLEKQSRNDLKIRQITKISKLLLFFPSFKLIQNHHFCWSSSLQNQMLHIIGQKKYNWDHQKWHFNVFIGQNFWDSHIWTRCRIFRYGCSSFCSKQFYLCPVAASFILHAMFCPVKQSNKRSILPNIYCNKSFPDKSLFLYLIV